MVFCFFLSFVQNSMTTAVIHLMLSLEKFWFEPISANIVVHKVRLIGFSPPLLFVSYVQYSSCLHIVAAATTSYTPTWLLVSRSPFIFSSRMVDYLSLTPLCVFARLAVNRIPSLNFSLFTSIQAN